MASIASSAHSPPVLVMSAYFYCSPGVHTSDPVRSFSGPTVGCWVPFAPQGLAPTRAKLRERAGA
jgi:hypothetical protein